MENVYEVRKRKKLYFIISEKEKHKIKKIPKVAILINLYYLDRVQYYYQYLNVIPEYMDLFVISSNDEVLKKVKKDFSERGNFFYIKKKNRGRDISALLVVGQKIYMKYDYICFTHDKKEKCDSMKNDIDLWNENLWGNTLKSEVYINNVINLFEENINIGLLVPPEPIGDELSTLGYNAWGDNYEEIKNLEKEMGLNSDIDYSLPPITFGTAFWCKVESIKKLFFKEWTYDDFVNEPMPNDGTISHAIERILAYIAQDAGFETGTIMTQDYAIRHINYLQEYSRVAFHFINNHLGIDGLGCIKQVERLLEYSQKNEYVCLYGAGKIAKNCLEYLRIINISPKYLIVSKYEDNVRMRYGFPIIEINELEDCEGAGIIVSVGKKLKDEIIQILEEKGIKNYISFYD